jgi:hypothetical protein
MFADSQCDYTIQTEVNPSDVKERYRVSVWYNLGGGGWSCAGYWTGNNLSQLTGWASQQAPRMVANAREKEHRERMTRLAKLSPQVAATEDTAKPDTQTFTIRRSRQYYSLTHKNWSVDLATAEEIRVTHAAGKQVVLRLTEYDDRVRYTVPYGPGVLQHVLVPDDMYMIKVDQLEAAGVKVGRPQTSTTAGG